MRSIRAWCALVALTLSACTVEQQQQASNLPPSAVTTPLVPPPYAQPAAAQQPVQKPTNPAAAPAKIAEIYPGREAQRRSVGGTAGAAPADTRPALPAAGQPQGDITLNFEEADIRQVAQAILRDILNVTFVIDPDVRGNVTVRTAGGLTREQVLPVFQTALQATGAGLYTQNGIYRIALLQNAGSAGTPVRGTSTAGTAAPTGGRPLQVHPLRYIGAEEIAKILQGVLPEGRLVYADPVRNVVVLQGSSGELSLAQQTIGIFDVDVMAEQSVLLESLQYADVGSLVFELENVFGGKNGPLAGAVRFLPLERLNAVLVIAKQQRYLEEARQWIARLDRTRNASARRLHVYYMQNGKAANIANTLRGVFGTGAVRTTTASTSRTPAPREGGGDAGTSPTVAAISEVSREGDQGVRIIADESNNAVLVLATPREYESIEEVLVKLDIMPLQVLIEASIIEVTLNDTLRYGVQHFLNTGDIGIAKNSSSQLTIGSTAGAVASEFATSSLGGPLTGGFSFVVGGGNTRAVIDALSAITEVNVVSNPQVMVLDNQTAKLQVGDEVPILTRFIDTTLAVDPRTVNSVEYRQTGVTLEVIPRVNVSGLVTLEVGQEVSDVTQPAAAAAIQSPTIRQRRIVSSVAVRSSETIALGGLIREQKVTGNQGIPVLHEIPILGALFGRKINDVTRTELLVLITPKVVRNAVEARDATLELRRKFQALLVLDNRGPASIRNPTFP